MSTGWALNPWAHSVLYLFRLPLLFIWSFMPTQRLGKGTPFFNIKVVLPKFRLQVQGMQMSSYSAIVRGLREESNLPGAERKEGYERGRYTD